MHNVPILLYFQISSTLVTSYKYHHLPSFILVQKRLDDSGMYSFLNLTLQLHYMLIYTGVSPQIPPLPLPLPNPLDDKLLFIFLSLSSYLLYSF